MTGTSIRTPTTVASAAGLTNGAQGILLDTGASNNTIGGLGVSSRNIIAFHAQSRGIELDGTAGTARWRGLTDRRTRGREASLRASLAAHPVALLGPAAMPTEK